MTDRPASSSRPARLARIALGVVLGVAAIEWMASARAYRPALHPDDWQAATHALAALPAEEPVWLGTAWLGPRARMHLPRLAQWDAAARPDLRGAPRFHVLGLSGDDWSDALQRDLEDLPAPSLTGEQALGGLTLYSYEQPAAGRVLADFVEEADRLGVQTPGGRCRGRAARRCEEGRVDRSVAEVDYRARRCLKVQLDDGVTVQLRYPQMPTGDVLRGHLGVHDYNARLRNDGPVRLELRIDDEPRGQWLYADTQGWWPFAVTTEPGQHDVELRLTPAVRGTWQRDGYQAGRAHAACVELRSLQEGSP